MLRKTKIIATLGPATESHEMVTSLIGAGVNIFRLNMSHAPHDWVRKVSKTIRECAAELGTNTAILLDTQGPAIRTGDLDTKLDLHPGDILEFTVRGARSEENYSVDVNYDGLIHDIAEGDTVLVDNGVIHLKVLKKHDNKIRCEVLTKGVLGSRRHINLPGVKVNLPPLTPKDFEDIALGAEVGVDFVALSFCREASDMDELRKALKDKGSNAAVIAKIEDQHAVKMIDSIIQAADGIMVARGDLGVECPMEDLPIIQRRIVKRCMHFGRPVIVATHMLESMIENPLPTRAEITDVANAVFEQADAIMLSGETTVGKYPVQCVGILDRVAKRIELSGGAQFADDTIIEDARQKTVKAAVVLANSFENSKIVVFTRRGVMADYTSHLRPLHAPIFAFAPSEEVVRRLALNWGTHAIKLDFDDRADTTVKRAENLLKKMDLVSIGDRLIVISDLQAGEERYDAIHVREI